MDKWWISFARVPAPAGKQAACIYHEISPICFHGICIHERNFDRHETEITVSDRRENYL